MLDKFTERAIKAVIKSKEEAEMLNHKVVGTEHLLLGLIAAGTGIPVRVLKAVGVKLEALREEVKKSFSHKEKLSNSKQSTVNFSNQALITLKIASEEAKKQGYIYVGSEHIFMALINNEDSGAIRVLKNLDIDLKRVKDTVYRITNSRSIKRAHPEIQDSKALAMIKRAITSKLNEVPFTLEDNATTQLIQQAKEEMQSRKNDTIGTEHLLLSLTKVENEEVKKYLTQSNITYEAVENAIKTYTTRNLEYKTVNYQMTPAAFMALEAAEDISRSLGEAIVRPEHVFLGILRENMGIAPDILRQKEVNTKQIYEKIVHTLEEEKPQTLSIIKLAQEEARRLEYNVVGTEHILLGLLCEGTGIAARVLNELGVNLKEASTR